MVSGWPTSSLLHPTYGSAARDIRAAVGVSAAARLDQALRQLDGVRRAMVLQERDFNGLAIAQTGAYQGHRVKPNPRREIGVTCPDGTVLVEPGADNHELSLRVDVEVVCALILECIKAGLHEDTDWLAPICDYCDSSTPLPPWPGG